MKAAISASILVIENDFYDALPLPQQTHHLVPEKQY